MDVFEEMVAETWKTVKADLLPRFLSSPLYRTCRDRMANLAELPIQSTFSVILPKESNVLRIPASEFNIKCVDGSLQELLQDFTLFEAFLAYLRSKYASEGLLCLNMINSYRQLWIISNSYRQVSLLIRFYFFVLFFLTLRC